MTRQDIEAMIIQICPTLGVQDSYRLSAIIHEKFMERSVVLKALADMAETLGRMK